MVSVRPLGTRVVTLHGESNFRRQRHPEETDWVLTLTSFSVLSIESGPDAGEVATAESLPDSWWPRDR